MTTSSEFRIASASDLHLGHAKVPAAKMIENLKTSFCVSPEFAKLDVLVFAGDVLDHMLQWPQDEVSIIEDWMCDIMRSCVACDVELIILEGTPSHDRRQSARFLQLNAKFEIGCKVTYVDKLEIRYFARWGINILFVPDEWSGSAERTLADVYEAMAALGLKKVDYAIMHGQFEFQLPDVVKAQKHDSDAYLAIVDKLIFIGHVHVFNRKDRIIAQGSHDRISHGEESPKGYVRAIVRSSEDYEIEFIENVNAAVFKTVDIEDLPLEDAIAACHEFADKMPDGAYVRIRANPTTYSLKQLEAEMETRYINLNWSSIDKASKDRLKKFTEEITRSAKLPDLITITPDNIERLVTDRIAGVENATQANIQLAMKFLKEVA